MPIGRGAAFEREALPHLDSLYAFAFSLAREPGRAEDLAQDTMLQAFRKFSTFEVGTNCKAWLFRICKNLFIDRFRAERRRPGQQGIDLVEPARSDPDRSVRHFQERGIESEEIFLDLFGDEVNQFLAELPEEFRVALLLCDLQGLSYQEISDSLEIPIGTVRSRISRARSFLRERLEEYASELGYQTIEVTETGMDDE